MYHTVQIFSRLHVCTDYHNIYVALDFQGFDHLFFTSSIFCIKQINIPCSTRHLCLGRWHPLPI